MVAFRLCHIIDGDPLLDLSIDVRDTSFVIELLLPYLLPIAIAAQFVSPKLQHIFCNGRLELWSALASAKSFIRDMKYTLSV